MTWNVFNPMQPRGGGGGGGGRKVSALISTFENFLAIKQYLRNFATFTKICWRTRLFITYCYGNPIFDNFNDLF